MQSMLHENRAIQLIREFMDKTNTRMEALAGALDVSNSTARAMVKYGIYPRRKIESFEFARKLAAFMGLDVSEIWSKPETGQAA